MLNSIPIKSRIVRADSKLAGILRHRHAAELDGMRELLPFFELVVLVLVMHVIIVRVGFLVVEIYMIDLVIDWDVYGRDSGEVRFGEWRFQYFFFFFWFFGVFFAVILEGLK